jgi:hypothetical protein
MLSGRSWSSLLALLLMGGCQSLPGPLKADANADAQFGAAHMRLHPIFTQVRSLSGGTKPDGIQAELEFQDDFGDPTKAAGTVRFELYPYRHAEPDPRGDRLASWNGSLVSVEEQYLLWNKTSRTYSFKLSYPGINVYANYVLTAVFQDVNGQRFFGRVILQGLVQPKKLPFVPPPEVGPATLPILGAKGEPTSLPILPPASAPSTRNLFPATQP